MSKRKTPIENKPLKEIVINGQKIPVEIKPATFEAAPTEVIVRPDPPPLFSIVPMTHSDPDWLPLPDNGPYYVLAKNREFVHKNTHFGRVLVEAPMTAIRDQLAVLEGKPDYHGYLWHKIPKLPAGLIGQAWSFFRQIYLDLGTEAMVYITWHPEKGYRFFVPPQENTGGKVDSKFNPEHIADGWKNVGTIHSHCNFGAFHSGTDTGDADNQDGLHITIGHVNHDKPSTAVMLAFNKIKWDLELSDVTDGTPELVQHPRWWERYVKKHTGQLSWEAADAWKNTHQRPTTTPSTWTPSPYSATKHKPYAPHSGPTWGYNATTKMFRIGTSYYAGDDITKTALAMANEKCFPEHFERQDFLDEVKEIDNRLDMLKEDLEMLGISFQYYASYDEDLLRESERINERVETWKQGSWGDADEVITTVTPNEDGSLDQKDIDAIVGVYSGTWSKKDQAKYRRLSAKPLHSLTQQESDWLLEMEYFSGSH